MTDTVDALILDLLEWIGPMRNIYQALLLLITGGKHSADSRRAAGNGD